MTVSQPKPSVLADYLETVATRLRDRGDPAIEMAALLAARGYPGATNGNGSRSSDLTSSTEHGAGLNGDDGEVTPNPWDGIDTKLAEDMRKLWYHATRVDGTMSRVLSHATTDDQVPIGTGLCYLVKLCEEKLCRPTLKDPDNRLKEGLGPACWSAWLRYRDTHPGATRQEYLDHRRATLRARGTVPG